MAKTEGFSNIKKKNFFYLFWPAFLKSFLKENILSGFECTGIHPFDPHHVISKFECGTIKECPLSSESVSSLKAEDWKCISKLLHEITEDVFDKQVQKLNNTVHTLAMDNLLLKMENNNLKSRLKEEKKPKKGKQQLKHAIDTSGDGGAIMYTPGVVKKTCDFYAEKD